MKIINCSLLILIGFIVAKKRVNTIFTLNSIFCQDYRLRLASDREDDDDLDRELELLFDLLLELERVVDRFLLDSFEERLELEPELELLVLDVGLGELLFPGELGRE